MATTPSEAPGVGSGALLLGTSGTGADDLAFSGATATAEHLRMHSLGEDAQPEHERMSGERSDEDEAVTPTGRARSTRGGPRSIRNPPTTCVKWRGRRGIMRGVPLGLGTDR